MASNSYSNVQKPTEGNQREFDQDSTLGEFSIIDREFEAAAGSPHNSTMRTSSDVREIISQIGQLGIETVGIQKLSEEVYAQKGKQELVQSMAIGNLRDIGVLKDEVKNLKMREVNGNSAPQNNGLLEQVEQLVRSQMAELKQSQGADRQLINELKQSQEADHKTITELTNKLGQCMSQLGECKTQLAQFKVASVPQPTPNANVQEVFSQEFIAILPPLNAEKRLILYVKSSSAHSAKLWQEGSNYCCSLESFFTNKENFAKLFGICQGLAGYSPKGIHLYMNCETHILRSYFDELIKLAVTSKSPEKFASNVTIYCNYYYTLLPSWWSENLGSVEKYLNQLVSIVTNQHYGTYKFRVTIKSDDHKTKMHHFAIEKL